MSQHDGVIDNQTFPSTRADLNAAFEAIFSMHSGDSPPSNPRPNQHYFNTSDRWIYIRNAGNTSWIPFIDMSGNIPTFRGTLMINGGSAANPSMGFGGDIKRGFYSPFGHAVGVSCNGEQVFLFNSSENKSLIDFVGGLIKAEDQFRAAGGVVEGLIRAAYGFLTDSRKGLFDAGANQVGIATNGVQRAVFGTNALLLSILLRAPLGSQASPGISFDGGGDSGFWLVKNAGADNDALGVGVEGTRYVMFAGKQIAAGTGITFAGDGSALTALPVSVVREIIAGFQTGERATYALLGRKSGNAPIVDGTIYPGTALGYAGLVQGGGASDNYVSGKSPSGSWQAMGAVVGTENSDNWGITLFKRV